MVQMMYILLRTHSSATGSLEVMAGNKLVVQNDGSNVDVLRVGSK